VSLSPSNRSKASTLSEIAVTRGQSDKRTEPASGAGRDARPSGGNDRIQTPSETWSIGIYAGESPLRLSAPVGIQNPVLTREDVTDVTASFVADPFVIRKGDRWYMFFEVLDAETSKGAIGLAVSQDGLQWAYRQIVLQEAYHLSYPYVFEWRGDHYMVPETLEPRCVRLYKASLFPIRWTCIGALVDGRSADPSIVRLHGFWWLFTCGTPYRHDTLRLYFAETLEGFWREHPRSPVISGDLRRARPAGRLTHWGGKLFRFAQDCHPRYGTSVRAFEITELSRTAYREAEVPGGPVIGPGGSGWNRAGMHHLDPWPVQYGRWLACVDGLQVD